MNVPLQDLHRHTAPVADEIVAACQAVVASGWFVLGREVAAFETEFAERQQTAHCVTVANGTDALELALRASGVGPGDEVVQAANAGMYSTVATLATGATPVYAEIEPRRHSIDPATLEKTFTRRTRAVVLTHLYGCAGYAAEIALLCKKAGVILVEDCAEAIGAKIDGRQVGNWGSIGCFSFYPTKNLGAIGDGGACVTADPELAKQLVRLRQYGWEKRYHAVTPGGRNSRLDEIQAAVLRRKLKHLDRWNSKRRDIAFRYNAAFADLPMAVPELSGEGHVAHLYVIVIRERDAFRAALRDRGVATDVHFPTPDYLQPSWPGPHRPSLPITERLAQQIVTLPCFPEMTSEEIEHVIESVRACDLRPAKPVSV